MSTLTDLVKALLVASPHPNREYYAFTLFLGENGTPEYSTFSHFVGYADESRRYELRAASLIKPDLMLDGWRCLEEPGIVINTAGEMGVFFSFGGHAIVEQTLAESVVLEWLAPNKQEFPC